VGFAWRTLNESADPGYELIATDNGRDLLGNDFPPCELNRVVGGSFYGWPFANGNRVKDPDFGAGHEREIAASVPPLHDFAAHNAPLGIAFLDAASTPGEYRTAALVALHGSWNRTTKDGYKVVSLHWSPDGRITERDFLTGFLEGENVIGRPVDVAQGRDGTIYISDDYGGSVFRVTFGGSAVTALIRGGPPSTSAPSMPGAPALPPSPAAIDRGRLVWNANKCEVCHDPVIIGKTKAETAKILERLSTRYDPERMVTYLRVPQPPMPLFEMSDQERRDLAVYVLDRFR
jgi:hypothetical protein